VKEDIMNQNHVQQLRLFRQLKEEQLQPEVNAWLKRCPLDVNRNINDYVPILNKLLIRSDQLYSEKKFSLSFIDCMKVGEFIMEMKRKRNDFKHSQKRLLQLLSASVTRAEKCKEEIVKSLHFGRKEQEEEIEQKSSQHLEYQQFQNKHNQQYHALDQKMEESVQQLEPECKPPSIPLPPLATTTPKDDFKLMRLHISMEQKKNEKIMKETKLHISMLKDEIKQKDCIIEETEKGNKMLEIKNISLTEDLHKVNVELNEFKNMNEKNTNQLKNIIKKYKMKNNTLKVENEENRRLKRQLEEKHQIVIDLLNEKYDNVNQKLDNIYTCSISYEKMIDPVITPAGQMYDRVNIEKWIKDHGTDPYTRGSLEMKQLTPVRVLKEK